MRQFLPKKNILLAVFVLILLFISGCEKNYNTIVDSPGAAPVLHDASFSLSVINTDTINVGGVHKPEDILTITGTASLRIGSAAGSQVGLLGFSVLRAGTSDVIGTGVLSNIRLSHGVGSTDSVYTGTADFQITRNEIGTFFLILWAENNSGDRSSSRYIPISILRINHPPVISNLQMDTLISIGGVDQLLILKLKATDQDGQSDISKVYFNSYKPNGMPSSGNPFAMFDDGSNGDSIAGDSMYTLNVSLLSNTSVGVYRFEFQAVDRTNTLSNIVIQKITITK